MHVGASDASTPPRASGRGGPARPSAAPRPPGRDPCDEQALDQAPAEHLAAKKHRIMPRPVERARLLKMIAAGREKELAQLASTT